MATAKGTSLIKTILHELDLKHSADNSLDSDDEFTQVVEMSVTTNYNSPSQNYWLKKNKK